MSLRIRENLEWIKGIPFKEAFISAFPHALRYYRSYQTISFVRSTEPRARGYEVYGVKILLSYGTLLENEQLEKR